MITANTVTNRIKGMKPAGVIGKVGSATLLCLTLVIAYELLEHGQVYLGAYMIIEKLMQRLPGHGGKGHDAAEAVLHISAH
jgi:hypothetical protein